MNLIEAVKSGRRFRRKSWDDRKDWANIVSGMCLSIPEQDLLADDWEVESEAVSITEQQFNLAVQRTLHEMDPDEHGFWDKLRKNIGL